MRQFAVLAAAAWLFTASSAQEAAAAAGAASGPAVATEDSPPPSPPPKATPKPAAPSPPPAVETAAEAAEEKRRLSSEANARELYMAAGRGDLDAVKTYLAAGAPIDHEANSGWTPLSNAAMRHENNYEAVVEYLLLQRANADAEDPRGRSALFFAVSDGASEACVKSILKYAKKLNTHDTHGVTAINVATRKGNIPAIKALLAAGADAKKGDSFGGSALNEAQDSSNNEIRTLFNLTARQPTPKVAGEL